MASLNPFSATSKVLEQDLTSTASTSVALPAQGSAIRLVNEGPNNAYVSIGSGTQTATLPSTSSPTATSIPILAYTDITLTIPESAVLNFSGICRATQTAILQLQVGEGQ